MRNTLSSFPFTGGQYTRDAAIADAAKARASGKRPPTAKYYLHLSEPICVTCTQPILMSERLVHVPTTGPAHAGACERAALRSV